MLATNGSELPFAPERWDEHSKVNNCYAYALNAFDAQRLAKPQPGEVHGGREPIRPAEYTCEAVTSRMYADFPWPHVRPAAEASPCPAGYYKIALAVDPHRDYHFYRQDADGTWSHKAGERKVSVRDASGQRILNPRLADQEYDKFNYSTFCGYFCVRRPPEYTMLD